MTATLDVIREAEARGVQLFVEGETLKWRSKSSIPGELLRRLREHKPEVIRELQGAAEGVSEDFAGPEGPVRPVPLATAVGNDGPAASGRPTRLIDAPGLPHPRPSTALVDAVNAANHFHVGFWLEGQLLMLQPPPRIPPAVHAAMNAMMARREEIVAICSSIARPKGYSDAHWLSAVVDAARLGYP